MVRPIPQESAMIETLASSELAQLTAVEFTRYFRHLAARVERAARSVTEEQLWTKPFPFGNSIGHLILHLTGNLNHYIGARIADSGYVRHREHEFTDTVRYPLDELLARFHQAVDMVVRTLEAQTDATFAIPVPDELPIQTRLGLFLVCAAHLNNHIGQMSYLVQALQASTNEPPVW
jgi:DinB superfamily